MLERVPDGRGRGRHVALGQAHQRETRLRVPPRAVGGEQGLVRTRDVTPVQADPSELVQRPPQLTSQVRAQLLAGRGRLALRLGARAPQPEDLGAVHPAAAVQAPDGVGPGPPLHHLGPLLGEVVQREALQGAHELAVDDPRRERVEVARDGRHPGLVEQRQTVLDVAVKDEQAGLGHPADGARRRLARLPHLDGAPGPLPSPGRVTGEQPLVGAHHREPRVRRRLAPPLEEPLRPRQPAAHRRQEGGVEEQVHRDADRGPGGRDRVTGQQARRVRPLPRPDGHIEVAGRIGDLAQHGQIGGGQEAVRVRRHEEVESLLPTAPGRRGPGALDAAGAGVIAHRAPPDPWPSGAGLAPRRP